VSALTGPNKPVVAAEEVEAHESAGEVEEGLENVRPPPVAPGQAAIARDPGACALRDSAMPPQPRLILHHLRAFRSAIPRQRKQAR